MVEHLRQFGSILTILLGWLLGLLTPIIVEKMRRPYRRRDLTRAVIDEMLGLQHTMALVSHRIRARYAEVTDDFLDRVLPIVEGCHGPERNEEFIRGLRESRKLSEEKRAAAHLVLRKSHSGITLRRYAIPLFTTQIPELAVCSVDFQRSALNIRYHLELFNQIVDDTRWLADKTFNKPSADDRGALLDNLEQLYRGAGTRAEIVTQAISDLQQLYGAA